MQDERADGRQPEERDMDSMDDAAEGPAPGVVSVVIVDDHGAERTAEPDRKSVV